MPSNQECQQPTIVRYPIHPSGESNLHLWGNPKASRLVICCPGFPDDQSSMAPLARRLAAEDCFVAVMCLPGYDRPITSSAPDGYLFDNWICVLREAVTCVRGASNYTGSATLTGIFHDWGVIAGLLYHEYFSIQLDKIILLDVLPQPSKATVPKELDNQVHENEVTLTERYLYIYQLAFATNFWLYQYMPKFLVFFFQYLTEATLTFLRCFPVSSDDYKYLQESGILPVTLSNCLSLGYKGYPYRNILRHKATIFNLVSLPPKMDNILFVYGGSKWIPLHHPTSLQLLASRAHCIPDAGHWLHCTHTDQCWPILRDFIVGKKVQ